MDTTSLKTITIPHGLKFTPSVSEVQVTWQVGGVTGFTFDIPPGVGSSPAPDATNLNVIAKVGTGTGVGGNTILARVTINSFQR